MSEQVSFARTRSVLSRPIRSLDGVRGIAVLLVMAHHFGFYYPGRTSLEHALCGLCAAGWCGVDLFFVLSGFLITGILLDTRGAHNYFRSFFARRILRIFPLFYAFLAAWFFLVPQVLPAAANAHESAYWLYLANWIPYSAQQPRLYHLWSLAVEEQFYLAWPFVVWALPPRALARTCVALAALAFAVRAGIVLDHDSRWLAYEITPARMDALALGALGALALRDERWHARVARFWSTALAIALCGIFAVVFLTRGISPVSAAVETLGYSLLALAFSSIVAAVVVHGAPALEAPWLRACGRYSYALYVLHFPILEVSVRTHLGAGLVQSRGGWAGFSAAALVVSFVLAALSWRFLEAPILGLKAHFTADRTALLQLAGDQGR